MSHRDINVLTGMEEMPSQNRPVQRLKAAFYHWTYSALGL